MTDEEKQAAEATAAELDARIASLLDAKLNRALKSRDKRLQAAIGKTLEEQLAKPAPAVAEKPGDKPSDGVPARADPAFLTMEQQLDRVTRELAESNKAAPEIPRPAVAPALRNCARGGEGGSRRSCSTR